MSIEKKCPQKAYIAGAHSRARTLKAYLNCLHPEIGIEAFLVDDLTENPKDADGIPVRLIGDNLDTNYTVYLGTRGENHPKLIAELEAAGFTNIIPVTVEVDRKLRNEYVRQAYKEKGKNFMLIDDVLPQSSS